MKTRHSRVILTTALFSLLVSPSAHAIDRFTDDGYLIDGFYLIAEAGRSTDRNVEGGHFSTFTDANYFFRSDATRRAWGMRNGVGFQFPISSHDRVGIEVGYGDYGMRRLKSASGYSHDTGNNDGTEATDPELEMSYKGIDVMLGYAREFGSHDVHLFAGAQRTRADLEYLDINEMNYSTGTRTVTNGAATRATYANRAKVLLGYEYRVDDSVGITARYSHSFGNKVDRFYQSSFSSHLITRPRNVPSLNTLMLGVHLYF